MQKIIRCLENILLTNFSLFIIFVFYSRFVAKFCFAAGVFLWFVISILKFRLKFYKHLIPKTLVNKPLLFFSLAVIASIVFSLNLYHSQSIFFERYIWYILFFLVGGSLAKERRNVFILVSAAVLGGIVIGLIGARSYLPISLDRFYFPFDKSIKLTSYLVLYFPLSCIVLFFARNKILRLGSLISSLLLALCLMKDASSGLWLAVSISILSISFLKSKRLFISLVVFFVIGTLLLSPQLRQRAQMVFEPSKWGNRLELWKTSLEIFEDFPVFGAGLGMYEKLLYTYAPSSGYSEGGIHLHAHNTFFEVTSETGVVGGIAFLWICLAFLRRVFSPANFSQDRDILAIQLGLTGAIFASLIFALACTVITLGVQDALLFWFLLGITASLGDGPLKLNSLPSKEL